MPAFFGEATLTGISYLTSSLQFRGLSSTPLKDYSGVVININQAPSGSIDVDDWAFQEFFLPSDYIRGTNDDEKNIPELTGIQLFVGIDEGYAFSATLDWKVQTYIKNYGWETLDQGTEIGAHADGDQVWFDIYLTKRVTIPASNLQNRFRFAFKGRDTSAQSLQVPVEYDGSIAEVGIQRVPAKLKPNVPFPFDNINDIPSFLYLDDFNDVTFSCQEGINKVWFNSPNPLTNVNQAQGYLSDGVTPLVDGAGNPASFSFRILASTADSGIDFLGNTYRSALNTKSPNNVTTFDSAVSDNYWLSKPNPSRFAVENLYFDVRGTDGSSQVIDSVFIDPLTPGVYFSIYYTDEPGVASIPADWDSKLWTRVHRTFKLDKRQTYILPTPVSASFIKIEFSHLQAKSYNPGDFQKPITYNKHPKWVLDYFLLTLAQEKETEDHFIASSVQVDFNALDLAYNYYLDDLHESPAKPVALDPSRQQAVNQFLLTQKDLSDFIDQTTLSKISLAMQPFQNDPALQADFGEILGQFVIASRDPRANIPTETSVNTSADTTFVSSTDRDAVIIENSTPVMFFFVDCRHKYRVVSAKFEQNRAYFVGVKSIAFQRHKFSTAFDADIYVENTGDNENMERNDFLIVDSVWQTYTP